MLVAISPNLWFLGQIDLGQAFSFPGGTRAFTGITMLVHMFFAQLFVGFAIASPVLQAWGARTGSPRMDRLAHSMTRFNVLTFSTGATFAVLFMVLLVGFYPRVTGSLFTHFFLLIVVAMASMGLALWGMYSYYYKWDKYAMLHKRRHIALGFTMGFFIWIWMVIMTGIDTYMTTGGGPGVPALSAGNVQNFTVAVQGVFNPMFTEMVLHRTFANLSWPAFAVATWAAFMYMRAKRPEDKSFYDWSTSVGLTWGVGFLLLQPFVGFATAYAMKTAAPADPQGQALSGGSYERLTSGDTASMLKINLILVVGLFVLSNVAMYMGAIRHPDRGGRVPIRIFGLVAAVAGLYSISPIADFPFLYMRYIAMLVMALATLGAFVTYLRGRLRFRYGSPGTWYRVVLLSIGVLAAVTALNMGFMKSNSRVPFTVYNQPDYKVESQQISDYEGGAFGGSR
ncbi:cytochrome ubiquinol oxidase subunit I [Rubrobacter aplysinae]|uniref:cytochrome ubiquinol oxidase subunit I n=1 Tax=Rubrobacter aplysinae TaxID=909625 RepID=UPI00064BF6EC|nr:cytochrome ubiquinol oxidase subunit I [Rubrobacter aplysinae]